MIIKFSFINVALQLFVIAGTYSLTITDYIQPAPFSKNNRILSVGKLVTMMQ